MGQICSLAPNELTVTKNNNGEASQKCCCHRVWMKCMKLNSYRDEKESNPNSDDTLMRMRSK